MFEIFFYFSIFAFGLIVGSFLNCIIYRLETEQSFLKGRSFCPQCKHLLSFWDLIPVFSFLFLKGRCCYCRKKISLQYPLVEIFTALIFLQIANCQNFINFIYLIIIACFLIIIFVYDLKHYIILNKVIYPAIIVALIYNLFFDQFIFLILVGLGAALPFFLIVAASKGKWMGGADIKLAFLMGLLLGWPNILTALFLAFLIGAFFGLILMALKRKNLKSEIPFAPFLISGTFIALFWGEKLITWYMSLFLI